MPSPPSPLPTSLPKPTLRKGPPPPPAPNPTFFRRRSGLWAGGFAVITIAGTLVGASLKSSHQKDELKTVKEQVEDDVVAQLALLESTRGHLMARKVQLEKKITGLRERQAKRVEAQKDKESRMEMAKTGGGVGR